MISIALHIVSHNQFYGEYFSILYVFLCLILSLLSNLFLNITSRVKQGSEFIRKSLLPLIISTWIQLTIKSAIIQQFYPTNSLPCFSPVYLCSCSSKNSPVFIYKILVDQDGVLWKQVCFEEKSDASATERRDQEEDVEDCAEIGCRISGYQDRRKAPIVVSHQDFQS